MHAAAASVALLLALGLAAGCGGDDGEGGDAASFVGVPWVLSAGVDVGAGGTAPSATFTNQTVAGSTGCNQFTAPYTVDGDAMEIGTVALTRMACPPPADAVERAYLAALGRVAAWHLDGSELILADDDHNELLRYEEASLLGDWEVTAFLAATQSRARCRGRRSPPASWTTARSPARPAATPTGRRSRSTGPASRSSSRRRPRWPAPSRRASWTRRLPISASFRPLLSFRLDGASLSLLGLDGAIVASYTRATQP